MLDIITPAASFDLTTVEAVNAELGLDNNTANDGLIAGYIAAASDSIARYCKRILVSQGYAETFYPANYKPELLLSEYPVSEIASIVENDETLAEDAFIVNGATGAALRLRSSGPTWWPAGTIVVTYAAGYSATTTLPTLPPSIERAAILLSCNAYRSRSNRDPTVRTVQHGDSSVTYGDYYNRFGIAGSGGADLPPDVIALLQPYRDYA